jgi:CelD/BcsL family acetyltransferase involved in cellulose biosynthesis
MAPVDRDTGLTVRVLSDASELVALGPEWNRFVESVGVEHPFLSHEWVRTWWDAFGRNRRLHVVLVRDGGVLVGLAPLMVSMDRMYGFSMRRIEFLANDHVPRFDLVVAGGREDVYRVIWDHIAGLGAGWDVVQLAELDAQSSTLHELTRLVSADGCRVGLWPSQVSLYVPVVGRWEDYLRTLRPKHRANLRNRLRRLERIGPVRLEVVTGGAQLTSALDDGLRLEAATWKRSAGTAIVCRGDTEDFYRRLAERASRKDWLRLHFLGVGGRRVAFAYCLERQGRLYVLKLGYDPEYAAYSPQNVLCFLVLRELFRSGALEYDFLGASDEWKRRWARHRRSHAWLFVFRPHFRPRLVHWAKFDLLPRLRGRWLYRTVRGLVLQAR